MEPAHRTELERWAEGLMRSEVAELRAAGRAIRSLCGENEALERRVAALERQAPARPEPAPRADEEPPRSPRRWAAITPGRRVLAAVAAVAVIGAIVALAARAAVPELAVTGPPRGALVGSAGLSRLEVSTPTADAAWLLDGKPVTPA